MKFTTIVLSFICITCALPPPPLKVFNSGNQNTESHIKRNERAVTHPIPRTGNQPLLIILADFSDKPGQFTGTAWINFFFGSSGFNDYFKEVSYNQLSYYGSVVGMNGATPVQNSTSVAYVRLPNPITYYANNQYGFGSYPTNHGGVVKHALDVLSNANFNFAPFADANNRVNNVVVVYAGQSYGYTNNAANSLQATSYRLVWNTGSVYTTSSGHTIDDYTFCPESTTSASAIAYIGICAHEHGHNLGSPDLYDFSYTTSGIGYYGIMAYGTFGGTSTGQRPFHPEAFTKVFFGWNNPTVITSSGNYVLKNSERNNQILKLVPNNQINSQEFFLIENRQAVGFDDQWTGAGLCTGILIWHIDMGVVNGYPYKTNTLSSVSGAPPHFGVFIVEADGNNRVSTPPINYGQCGDSWTVGRTWNNESVPNSNLWNGGDSGISVQIVSQSGGDFTLRIEIAGSRPEVSTGEITTGANGGVTDTNGVTSTNQGSTEGSLTNGEVSENSVAKVVPLVVMILLQLLM